MKLPKLRESFSDEKGILRNGILLITFAAIVILLIAKFDTISEFLSVILKTSTPLFGGIVLAYVLNVLVTFFEKVAFKPFKNAKSKIWLKIKRPLAITLSILIVILIVLIILLFILPDLINSLETVAQTAQKNLPIYIDSSIKWIESVTTETELDFIVDEIKAFNWSSALGNMTKFTTDFLTSILSATMNVASAVFTVIVAFIFSIYMLGSKEKLLRNLKAVLFAFLSVKTAKKIIKISSHANGVYFSFIRGQLTECVINGSLCYIGMLIFGFDYALLISSVVALCALIPIVGAFIGASVGFLLLLIVNPMDAIWFLLFFIVLQQIDGNLIYPRVVGSSIGLPPIWTMFAVLFWGSIFGIPGILLGTATTAVVYQLLTQSVSNRLKTKKLNPVTFEEDGAENSEIPETVETKENVGASENT